MTDLRALEQRQARDLAATRKKLRADKPKRVIQHKTEPTDKRQRQPRQEDPAYLSWLHDGLPCVACVRERAVYAAGGYKVTILSVGPIEAAHQKFNLARPGWVKFTGKRVHDRQCLPLCRWHHQDAPNACDKAQAKFWTALGFTLDQVADLCAALYAAFKAGADHVAGAAIIQNFARRKAA